VNIRDADRRNGEAQPLGNIPDADRRDREARPFVKLRDADDRCGETAAWACGMRIAERTRRDPS
jgi:hypothetical protein